MVYNMVFRVDGGCRGNGRSDAIGAAACCLYRKSRGTGRYRYRTADLPRSPTPTNQRAELTAIILALEWAVKSEVPNTLCTIYSDSQYAVKCMTQWIYRWIDNDWKDANGHPVKNQDLIKIASELAEGLCGVTYIWVPRDQNHDTDRWCNVALDAQEALNQTLSRFLR